MKGMACAVACAACAVVAANAEAAAAAPVESYAGVDQGRMLAVAKVTVRGGDLFLKEVAVTLPATCSSSPGYWAPDGYSNVRARGRSVSARFGPERTGNDDGTTTVRQGSMSGRFNRDLSRITGRWTLRTTVLAADGSVADVCTTGRGRWHAEK